MLRGLALVQGADHRDQALVKRPLLNVITARAKLVSVADVSLRRDQPSL
jgi:hypothetical protein